MKLKFSLVALSIFCGSVSTTAAEPEKPAEGKYSEELKKVEEAKNKVISVYREAGARAQESRAAHSTTILFNYSPFDLVLPSKMGGTLALHSDGKVLYELEYLSSSIAAASYVVSDLASMSEQRISLLRRKFSSGGTFNWFWGFAHNTSKVHVSKELMDSLNNPNTSDTVEMQTLGMTIGVGNRWVFKERFSIGVDWFSWSQPIVVLKKDAAYLDSSTEQSDRDKVNTIMDVVGYFPRVAAFKVQFGYSF